MRRFPLALLALSSLIAASCKPVATGLGLSEECTGNFPPEIGNLEVNSWQDSESGEWVFCLHVDWIDPGRDEAGTQGTGAPNMLGGMWSAEIEGLTTPSSWVDEAPSPKGITLGANAGELERAYCGEHLVDDRVIDFEVRLRDRCDAVSNEKSGSYVIGGGGAETQQVENPGVGGDGCNPINYIDADGNLLCERSGD